MPRHRQSNTHLPVGVYVRKRAHTSTYYFADRDGKQHRLGSTLAEALRAHSQLVESPSRLVIMSDLFTRYQIQVLHKKRPSTQESNMREFVYLRAFFGEMAIEEVRPMHVAQYLDQRGEVAPVRANREKSLLSHVFSMAMRWGLAERNPCVGVHRNPEKPRDRLPTPEELALFCKLSESALLRAWVIVKWLTGLRQSDMRSLQCHQLRDDGIHVTTAKTGHKTIIEWTPELRRAIDAALEIHPLPSDFVFSTRQGTGYSADGFRAIWQRAMVKFVEAGGERFTEHDIRARTATDARAQGIDAQRLLGHAAASTTDTYIRRRQVEVVSSLKKITKKD